MSYTNGLDNPELHFQAKIYTGDGNSNQVITFDGSENMKPDWVWIKIRNSAHQHTLIDSTRGANKALLSNDDAAEDTDDQYGWLSSFNTDGFTTQDGSASDHWNVNKSGNTYVSWNWKANGGTTSSNSNGSITSTVQANTTAGFSIVSYAGTGSNATVGHGLGSVPSSFITKSRDTGSEGWMVYHASLGATKGIRLNENSTSATVSTYFNDTAPTSSVFSIGTNDVVNKSGDNYIAYVFAEKKGYSKFGSYTGNGSSDGTFINLGFRPAWVLYKNTTTADSWFLHDNKRQGFNDDNELLFADLSNAESTVNRIRILSNGFKAIDSDKGVNKSGDTYIYYAIAEAPFTNSSGVPTNAR